MTRLRSAAAAVAAALTVFALSSSSAGADLRWEGWAENATAGAGSEGTHAWISHGLYERGREMGLERGESAGLAFGVMAVWEVCEVEMMDAQGVSVQDLAANTVGVVAGLAGVGVRYSYATYGRPDASRERPWLGVPVIPRNDLTYAIELEHEGWTLGYKYMGEPGDLVVGTTSMPVLSGESGKQRLVACLGHEWSNGWHCAVGYDGLGEVSVGGGRRLSLWGLGIDLNALGGSDGLALGVSCFVDYAGLTGRK